MLLYYSLYHIDKLEMEAKMSNLQNDNYINIDEAATYLGVKPSTIRSWIKTKGMPSHRVGGKLLKFKKSEIDEWVNNEQKEKRKI